MEKPPKSLTDTIDNYCGLRNFAHDELLKRSGVYDQIIKLNNKNLTAEAKRKGGLEQKEKVLALLGMHMLSGSNQSIEFALSAALQVGATENEIMDIVDLALLTGGGRAVASAHFAIGVLTHRGASGDKDDRFEFVVNIK